MIQMSLYVCEDCIRTSPIRKKKSELIAFFFFFFCFSDSVAGQGKGKGKATWATPLP
jgi:hypothetical protein